MIIAIGCRRNSGKTASCIPFVDLRVSYEQEAQSGPESPPDCGSKAFLRVDFAASSGKWWCSAVFSVQETLHVLTRRMAPAAIVNTVEVLVFHL